MKIIFVTSIIPPDIGGPALYAAYLPTELEKRGVRAEVICLPKLPKGLRECVYTGLLMWKIRRCEVMYALSASPAVTLPAVLLSKIFGKKFCLRPGGDLLWERAIEKGETQDTLSVYYKKGDHKKHFLRYKALSYSLRHAALVVFPTGFLKELYVHFYSLRKSKCEVVDYPFPKIPETPPVRAQERIRQFLFAGRLIRLKNAQRLIRAFATIEDKKGFRLKVVGEGPQKQHLTNVVGELGIHGDVVFQDSMPHSDLLAEISRSYCVVIPSIFESGSFLALDCLKLKIPLILTQEAGLYERYKDTLLCVNPYSLDDIRKKIEFLMDAGNYKQYCVSVEGISTGRGWGDVAEEHVRMFETILQKKVLFIGVTSYNFYEENPHLAKKFEGLRSRFEIYSIARGKPWYARRWGCDFYLLPHRALMIPLGVLLGVYLCATKRVDTIVCQSPLTESLLGVLLSKIFRKELIVEIHGDWKEMPFISRKRIFAPLLKKIVPAFGAWSLRRADKIRVVSKYFENVAKKEAPNKPCFTFPTFTDINDFLEEKNTSIKKYILTVAVLSPIKSIETLIEAFARIQERFDDFKLVIAGDGPSRNNLQRRASDLQLQKKIIFTGRLSLREVKDVMKDCSVFVVPSLSEGLARVLIEAMALQKPVIATRVGGTPEVVRDGENGFLIEPKNVSALAEKLKVVLENRELAKQMGVKGRNFVSEHFSNEKYIQHFVDMVYAQ